MQDVNVCPRCGALVRQDEDVLDTWFSSQLWTFATQGWPHDPAQLKGHHPTTALVTARDIIALWVARMVMSSQYFLGEIPFRDVVIYATILAKDGSRMSKSKGNGVDPMDLIQMYGADAMRFNLLTLVTNNQDVRFDADIEDGQLLGSPRTEAARSFVTKIWNAARFVLMNLDGFEPGAPEVRTPADAWILTRLAKLGASVTDGLAQYRFGDVARELHGFFWNEFCDWYIELSKAALKDGGDARLAAQRNLVFILDNALRLLHPVMPFVTEEIWRHVPTGDDTCALMVADWPDTKALAAFIDEEAEASMSLTVELVSSVRQLRARYGISPKQALDATVRLPEKQAKALASQASLVTSLANLSNLDIACDAQKPAGSVSSMLGAGELHIALAGVVDLEAERARIEKQIAKLEADAAKLDKKLANPGFLAKAAEEVIQKDRTKHAEILEKLELARAQLGSL